GRWGATRRRRSASACAAGPGRACTRWCASTTDGACACAPRDTGRAHGGPGPSAGAHSATRPGPNHGGLTTKTPPERGFRESPLPDSNRRPLPYHRKIDVLSSPREGKEAQDSWTETDAFALRRTRGWSPIGPH